MRFQNKTKLLTFCFFTILALLIGQLSVNVKDINDSWILEGIFPLFLSFMAMYALTVSFSSDTRLIAIVTSIYLVTVVLIPNLKYFFVYGYHDPMAHYGFIRDMAISGHIPSAGFYADQYGATPGSHILVSTLSLVAGLNVETSMKAYLIVSPFLLPLAVYLVLKKLDIPLGLSKIIIIATAITSPALHIFTGLSSIYSVFVLFIYFWLLIACQKSHTRANFVIVALLSTRIIISHDVTSFFVLTCMSLALVLYLFNEAFRSSARFSHITAFLSVTIVSLTFTHFIFASSFNFSTLLLLIRNSIGSVFTGGSPVAFEYYQGFYTLDLTEKIEILAVRFGQSALSLLLLTLTPLAIFRLKPKSSRLLEFYRYLAIPTSLALLMFILPLFIRPLTSRGLGYLSAFFPFLVGATIFWFIHSKPHRFQRVILAVLTFSLISISIFQIYPYQPLLPRVSTDYGEYYVADWRQVSTAYTRSMIVFATTHNSRLSVWTDTLIRWEIYGLANSSFQSLLTWHSDAPLILASHAGKAHIIASVRGAVSNEQYLQNALQETNIIYNNGESYALLNMTGT